MRYEKNDKSIGARLCFFCFSQGFHKLMGYLCDISLPSGRRNFGENEADHHERHKHFSFSCLFLALVSAALISTKQIDFAAHLNSKDEAKSEEIPEQSTPTVQLNNYRQILRTCLALFYLLNMLKKRRI